MTTVNYFVPSISCGGCKHTIETELGDLKGVQSVSVEIATKQVALTFDAPASEDAIDQPLVKAS